MSVPASQAYASPGRGVTIFDQGAHPSELYSLILAGSGATATLTGRFLDAGGQAVIVNPKALANAQVTLVALEFPTSASNIADALLDASIDNGGTDVADIPAKAVAFVGVCDHAFVYAPTQRPVGDGTYSNIGSDPAPTANDPKFTAGAFALGRYAR